MLQIARARDSLLPIAKTLTAVIHKKAESFLLTKHFRGYFNQLISFPGCPLLPRHRSQRIGPGNEVVNHLFILVHATMVINGKAPRLLYKQLNNPQFLNRPYSVPAVAILAIDNRFRPPSLELKCLGTSLRYAKTKVSIPRDSTCPPCCQEGLIL